MYHALHLFVLKSMIKKVRDKILLNKMSSSDNIYLGYFQSNLGYFQSNIFKFNHALRPSSYVSGKISNPILLNSTTC